MWSVLISTELNGYRIMVDFYGYKSSAPSDTERQQLPGASRKSTRNSPPRKKFLHILLRTSKQLLAQKQ
ncbi:hypothetical protein QLX08_007403 [Tetragonisca angustula]|uniref:Uncharacterized protein n=1 Tax=Tetragonisca angustula TaxID=166442 RepID=A0AAW0ZP68_9HYME